MALGYIYVMSNQSMPGLLKIGRTDRRPETRAKELASATGVPSEFKIEFTVLVSDSVSAERHIHEALEKKGHRHSKNREFFTVPLDEAIEIIRQVSVQVFGVPDEDQYLLNYEYLRSRFNLVSRPGRYNKISLINAEALEAQLLPIAQAGYDYAYSALAHIFLENYPISIKYRMYSFDYFDSEFSRIKREWTKSGMQTRLAVGQNLADFLESLYLKQWIGNHDFDSVQRFLISADGYTYEGFINAVKRSEFPSEIRDRALNL